MAYSAPLKPASRTSFIAKHLQTVNRDPFMIWKEGEVKKVIVSKDKPVEVSEKNHAINESEDELSYQKKPVDRGSKTSANRRKPLHPKSFNELRNNIVIDKSEITCSNCLGQKSKQMNSVDGNPISRSTPFRPCTTIKVLIKTINKDMVKFYKNSAMADDKCNGQAKEEQGVKEMLQSMRLRKIVKEAKSQLLADMSRHNNDLPVKEAREPPRTNTSFVSRLEESSDDSDDTARYIRSSRRPSSTFRLPMSFRPHCYMSKIKAYRQMKGGQKTESCERSNSTYQSGRDLCLSKSDNTDNADADRTSLPDQSDKMLPNKNFRSRGTRKRRGRKQSYRTTCLETSEEEHDTSNFPSLSTHSYGRFRSKVQYQKRQTASANNSRLLSPIKNGMVQEGIVARCIKQLSALKGGNVLKTQRMDRKKTEQYSTVKNIERGSGLKSAPSKLERIDVSSSPTSVQDNLNARKRKNIIPGVPKICVHCSPINFASDESTGEKIPKKLTADDFYSNKDVKNLKVSTPVNVMITPESSRTNFRYGRLNTLSSDATFDNSSTKYIDGEPTMPILSSTLREDESATSRPPSYCNSTRTESTCVLNSDSKTPTSTLKTDPIYKSNENFEVKRPSANHCEVKTEGSNTIVSELKVQSSFIGGKLKTETTNTINSKLTTEPFKTVTSKWNTEVSNTVNGNVQTESSNIISGKWEVQSSNTINSEMKTEVISTINTELKTEVGNIISSTLKSEVTNTTKSTSDNNKSNTEDCNCRKTSNNGSTHSTKSLYTKTFNNSSNKKDSNSPGLSDNKSSENSSDEYEVITIYTPEMRSNLSKSRDNYKLGYFDLTPEYLRDFVRNKSVEQFFKSYIGCRRFSVNSIIYFKISKATHSDGSELKSSEGSDVENDLGFIDESGYLYELGHKRE